MVPSLKVILPTASCPAFNARLLGTSKGLAFHARLL